MSVTIISGTNKKPVSSEALSTFFQEHQKFGGQLFLGFPILGTPEGRFAVDAMWLTPSKGIVVFDLVEGRDLGSYLDRQDEAFNLLEAKLRTHRELLDRRSLLVPISTLTFAPAIQNVEGIGSPDCSNLASLSAALNNIQDWEIPDSDLFKKTLSAIQSISTIRKSKVKRKVEKPDSRGAILKRLEDSIATLDSQQGKAVVETVEGVQRIRGLAGSGKTIVLALKAAYLHAQHPDWRIAVTFNTRSLKGQFRRLINTFCIEQTGEEPDWGNLKIINAWGAPGDSSRNGVYHEFCKLNDINYYDYGSAKSKFGSDSAFSGVCTEALSSVKQSIGLYDCILVDEAQDFPSVFLRLCYKFLTGSKRFVYAYDELQTLSGESLPPPENIFGNKADGTPNVKFNLEGNLKNREDILLDKCYRNSRPVLVAAHALGFGIYREPPENNGTGLVQMFDHPGLWEDVGYRVISGHLKEGESIILERTGDTSPQFLEDHSPLDDLIQFFQFETEDQQADWLVNSIIKNITQDELRHDDIIVINTNPITTRKRTGPIRKMLYERRINSHLAGVDTDPDVFFQSNEKSVTFTGIHRAKGNEAGMVYIMNAQDCHSSMWNLATIRNRLFTAMTRSKAWVRVIGVGESMGKLIEEYNRLKDKNYVLDFKYPNREEREKLKIIHRDMTIADRKKLEKRKEGLEQLLLDLEKGTINPEDIGEDIKNKLQKLLMKK